MKNTRMNVGSFATAKLQANSRRLLAIALLAIVGFAAEAQTKLTDGKGASGSIAGNLSPVTFTYTANRDGYLRLTMESDRRGVSLSSLSLAVYDDQNNGLEVRENRRFSVVHPFVSAGKTYRIEVKGSEKGKFTITASLDAESLQEERAAQAEATPRLNNGKQLVEQGKYDDAIRELSAAIENNPNMAEAYAYRAEAYLAKKDGNRALADVNKAIQLDPKIAMAYKARGDLTQDFDKAVADYTEAIRLDPNYARAYNERGAEYFNKGDYDRAAADFEAAVRINPDFTVAKNNLAATKNRQERAAAQDEARQKVLASATAAQGKDVQEKLQWLQVFAKPGSSYYLELSGNGGFNNGNLEYSGKNNITITLLGPAANRATASGQFTVGSGITLVVESNITIDTVLVKAGGTLIMNNGAAMEKGIVGIEGRGTFTMNGGTISGREDGANGGAVNVLENGTFTMNGGTISRNKANFGGGVYVAGTFTMNGGTISRNSGSFGARAGGGVYVAKGGTFTMKDGTISGNDTRGSGGGVYVAGKFTMSGGTITGNLAEDSGGGVYVAGDGTFSKTGGTITGYASNNNNGNSVKGRSYPVPGRVTETLKNFRGHAVFVDRTDMKIKEGTSGPEETLEYTNRTAIGDWDN